MGNRQVVENFMHAIMANDLDAQDSLLHDDYELDYPQWGERIRGRANRRAMFEYYPGVDRAALATDIGRIIGSDDQFIATPSWNIVHLAGSGDEYQATGTILYPDGQTWHFVALLKLREGKIWRQSDYFGLPFEAPAWRSAWVEPHSRTEAPATQHSSR